MLDMLPYRAQLDLEIVNLNAGHEPILTPAYDKEILSPCSTHTHTGII